MRRAAILAKICARLKVKPDEDATRGKSVEARLAGGASQLVPDRGRVGAEQRIALFKSFLAAQATDLIETSDPAEIPQAIAEYLRGRELPLRVRTGSDPLFARLPWTEVRGLERTTGTTRGDDAVGVSRAIAGVAETGTLVLASGPCNPTTLAFLPEMHIVVVRRDAILGSYEEAIELTERELVRPPCRTRSTW
jgi:L-lactate dehydrogenase complex protein LldG